MSRAGNIAKNLSALFTSHLVAILQQIALVPLFLHRYGKAGYGEWLTLSAAVTFLGTLDFGVQTYLNQDLTVRYHQGDMEEFHIRQSTAMRLMLGIFGTAAVVATSVFLMPLDRMLKLNGVNNAPAVPAHIVQTAVFFLALQALTSITFGYVSGTFMVVGRAHVGGYWNNVKNLSLIVAAAIAVLLGANFAVIAISQFTGIAVCLLGALLHLRSSAPQIFPTLRYWDRNLIGPILKPSGYFALIYSSNFLVYQLPILVLQRTVGPAVVTVFSIMRTIFSMTRSMLNALSQSLGPEVTNLFAKDDWPALVRLYNTSERLIFSFIPMVNLAVLFACPLLLTIWVKNPSLFVPGIYLVNAAVSIVMSTKEHKFQFQFSTNTHRELARFMFFTYLILVGLWFVIVPRYGLLGLIWCWLVIESAQVLYLVILNGRFFAHVEKLNLRYIVRLAGLSAVFLVLASVTLPHLVMRPLWFQGLIATAVGGLIFLLDIPLFGVREVVAPLVAKLRGRFAGTTP
ncbi:MAG: hypothetical protein JSS87_12870 [Acidobacteria bacterium]|nr:hypothetical protein [Acidobacteriota bacterium]